MRRTSPNGAKSERAPLPRHSVRREEKCLLAGAFRRCGARAPTGRSQRSEESPRSPSLARGSLHFTTFRVRDDRNNKKAPTPDRHSDGAFATRNPYGK